MLVQVQVVVEAGGQGQVQVDSGRGCLDMSVLSPHILNRLYPSIDLLDLVFVFFFNL